MAIALGAHHETGGRFDLPHELVTQTLAITGIRGSGKTTTAKVLAEGMCRARLPWIAFDPVGVWWGLRANRDGTPSDLPVVVFGGRHGDLPLAKDRGADIARAIVRENVCAVIDLHRESKTTWRTFLVDFCLALMEVDGGIPRHVFIEEAPEFCPQRGRHELTQRTKEAVERLARLGRNHGYGCTLLTQRTATVDKDVLSQCENVIVMRTPGKHDRDALKGWLEAREDPPDPRGTKSLLSKIAKLPSGHAYVWSPEWLECFERIVVDDSTTFHPGATRRAGQRIKSAELGDVGRFVSGLERQLAAPPAERPTARGKRRARPSADDELNAQMDHANERAEDHRRRQEEIDALKAENTELLAKIDRGQQALRQNEKRLVVLRKVLKPVFDALGGLFADNGEYVGGADAHIWEPWLERAGNPGSSRRRMLETIIERRELTRSQWATLAGVHPTSKTTRNNIGWMNSNGLIEKAGDRIRLRDLA